MTSSKDLRIGIGLTNEVVQVLHSCHDLIDGTLVVVIDTPNVCKVHAILKGLRQELHAINCARKLNSNARKLNNMVLLKRGLDQFRIFGLFDDGSIMIGKLKLNHRILQLEFTGRTKELKNTSD